MTPVLHMVLIAGSVLFAGLIVHMLCREVLSLRYSLTWLLAALAMIVLALLPRIAVVVARAMGVAEPVNAVFLIVIFFSILVSLSLTVVVSRQSVRIGKLAQELALLERALRQARDERRDRVEL